MTAKTKKKKSSIAGKVIGIVCLCFALFIALKIGKSVIEMVELQNEQKAVAEELTKLKEENESLVSTKSKLEDPNYVTTYARGEYMFSKGDEKLFRLPSSSD